MPLPPAVAFASLGLLLLPLASSKTTWTTGAQARSTMETMIQAHARAIQSKADYIYSLDEIGSCSKQAMCDSDPVWADESLIDSSFLAFHDRFNDPLTQTCVGLDLDMNGNILPTPVTGRTTLSTSKTICGWSAVKETFSGFEVNSVSKQDALNNQGCITDSDKTKCITNINPDVYTYIMPSDSSYDIEDDRPRAEICATNTLVEDIGIYSFVNIMNDYTQTGWTWLGMQETGLYRTWPSIYQCRTENQCSGCSDPRYRGWYASAAAGSKDVIIVIDTSGSMNSRPSQSGCTECSSTDTRMDYVKEAASWVINTLSAADYAMVIKFSDNGARSQSSTMLPMNMLNRAILKDYIDNLSPDGNTPMDKAFEKAFEVIEDSEAAGKTSGCTKNILFLTDGQNSGDDQTVIDIIQQKNGGPYEGEDLHYESGSGQNGGLTLISTYAFGDGASPLMSQIACEHGGVYHNIADSDAKHLKEIMANYYTYMAAGMVPPDSSSDPVVRWADIYEDGQGRGQVTGACSPVYSFHTSPAQLIGVTCLGISIPVAENLIDWDLEWADIQSKQGVCYDVLLTWEELETIRGRKLGDKQYTQTCAQLSAKSSGGGSNMIIIIAVVVGALVLGMARLACGGSKKKPTSTTKVAVAPAPTSNASAKPSSVPVQPVPVLMQPTPFPVPSKQMPAQMVQTPAFLQPPAQMVQTPAFMQPQPNIASLNNTGVAVGAAMVGAAAGAALTTGGDTAKFFNQAGAATPGAVIAGEAVAGAALIGGEIMSGGAMSEGMKSLAEMGDGVGVGAIALVEKFPIIGNAFAVLGKLYSLYKDEQDKHARCAHVVKWSTSIVAILESIAQHYAANRASSYTEHQKEIIKDVVESLADFTRESEKHLKKNMLVAFLTSSESDRRIKQMQGFVDTNLRNLMVGMQVEAVRQNDQLLRNSALTFGAIKQVNYDVDMMRAENVQMNAQVMGQVANMSAKVSDQFGSINDATEDVKQTLEKMNRQQSVEDKRRDRTSSMEIDDRKVKWVEKKPFANGSFGSVYRVEYEGETICAKMVSLREVPDKALEATKKEYIKEVALMAELRSLHIVQIIGAVTRKTELIILMEYCEGGSLREKLDRVREGTETKSWGPKEQLKMLLDISYGMDYLHSKKIIHQDLKSLNVLINEKGKGKVSDFGKSRSSSMSSQQSAKGGDVGTYAWCAPEIIKGEKQSEKADVYSFGIMIWEVATSRIPWDGMENGQIIGAAAYEGKRPEIQEGEVMSTKLRELMEKCWSGNKAERPYFDSIVDSLYEVQEELE